MVFYYDTGNSKSYAGEPTVNLHPDPENVSNWTGDLFGNWTRSAVTPNVSVAPDGTLTADRIGDGYGRFNSSITAIPGQTYVYTVYVKNVDLTNNFGIAVAWGLNGSLVSYNGNATTVQISQISDTEWTRITATEIAPSSGINQVQFGPCPFTGHGNPSGQTVDVWGGMIEQKSHATPYTAGTRSATEALKDFTKNATLDLSNVSFDSNAQMTFDGTTDYVTVPHNPAHSFTGDFSIEIVFRPTGNTANCLIQKGSGNDYFQEYWVLCDTRSSNRQFELIMGQVGNTSANYNVNASNSVTIGQYHHIVTGVQGSTGFMYVNGELIDTGAVTDRIQSTSDIRIGERIDGFADSLGDQPITKIYNRALSAEEVQQNFNTIKGRFGI